MKFPRSTGLPYLCLLCMMLVAAPTAVLAGEDWKPVDPADLALKEAVVEKDADAEVLTWDVHVNDNDVNDLVFNHYIRIKVFTERGREAHSRIDILYPGKAKVKDIAGRTIKPDGQIVELKKEDIFERTVVKAGGRKVKAKSFAMPGVEPGAIVEYRWREVFSSASADHLRLELQRNIPVRNVTYHIKPYSGPYASAMRAQYFNMTEAPKIVKKDGFYTMTMTNMPAFREEPRMPPEDQVRTWMLLYYTPDNKLAPERYWKEFGKRVHELVKPLMKANDEVKKAAEEAVGDATTPEQKLERIYDFCRTKIKNSSNDAAELTNAEREKLKANKSPSDTLKRGVGDGADIDLLFAAMASAIGLDARVALTAARNKIFFNPNFTDPYFLEPTSIAVRLGDGWRFFNPGYNYLPFGGLRWQEEGTMTLVTDPKEPEFVITPVTPPGRSLEKRTAKLRLDADGTLEGDVRIEYTGQAAVEIREYNDEDSPAQREETLKSRVQARLGGAELSNIRIENVTDSVKPFVYAYHVRVPGYAQRTGKRLFIQPAFFQRGVGQLFPTSTRRNDIYFNYPWSEEDYVEIQLPEGYALDNAEAPSQFGAAELSQYQPKLSVSTDGRILVYHRKFFFGGDKAKGGVATPFPASSYSQLKAYFDELHKQDNHTIAIKQGAAATATTSTAKPSN
ncbi:MAG TPA: DUF3857 and transglutaminase domain-containing protein [Pyrinomonadaceae bacterium]|nr:DUF3857 and transglutaminase domain-containing protein [Pyrinomonadaceae bacterium]